MASTESMLTNGPLRSQSAASIRTCYHERLHAATFGASWQTNQMEEGGEGGVDGLGGWWAGWAGCWLVGWLAWWWVIGWWEGEVVGWWAGGSIDFD